MITVYVLSKDNLSIKDVFESNGYSIETNIEFSGKISVDAFKKPNIVEDDFLILKLDEKSFFYGICSSVENEDGNEYHKLNINQIESMFDLEIIIKNEILISSTGIEDFIKQCIVNNFVISDDPFLNRSYIQVNAGSHTRVLAGVDHDNGIFNLKTYLGNALEYYGICLDFEFTNNELIINICKKEQNQLIIDATVTDIVKYIEIYDVKALAKLKVLWKVPDEEDENGNQIIGAKTVLDYFLLNDRTITEDKMNINRAKGTIETVYIEKKSKDEVDQEVINKFKGNSYNHSVEADVLKTSQLYPLEEFYLGHECVLKTKSRGVQESLITKISLNSKSNLISVKFGKMKVTLIEKLREERKG